MLIILDPGLGYILLWPQRLYSIYNLALSQHLLLQAVSILKGGNRNKHKCGYDDEYRGWVQEEKGTTEDEMAGWHH